MALDPERLEQIVGGDKAAGEKIKSLLLEAKKETRTIKVGDLEIKVRISIPKGLRRKINDMASSDTEDMDKVESGMYQVIAEMCVESPFDTAEAWSIIDEETGIVPEVLKRIYAVISETEDQVKRFR
jgi:hypothetical protein